MADWNQWISNPHTLTAAKFAQPDGFLGPVYSWVWNAPVDEEKIRRQIDEMTLAGIRAFYIIPEPPEFRPETMITSMTPEYLSPEFFRLIRLAVEYARQKDMLVWIYDEGGWPSGSACGQVVKLRPDLAGKRLAMRAVTLKAGDAYVPGEGAVGAFGDRMPVKAGDSFAQERVITEYFREIRDQGPNPALPDLLEPDTIPLFIQLTHERYAAALGDLAERMVPCVFTDEPYSPMPAFPWDFPELFREKYGYDIEDFLYAVLEKENLSPEASQARQDYADLVTELYEQRFMQPLLQWCRERGMIFTGHLDKDHAMGQGSAYYGNPLALLRKMDMPGLDVIWRQIYPGEHPVPEGESFFPRIPASAASQSGHLLSLSESFAVYGQNITPETMRWVCNYQLVRGVQILTPMIIPFGREGALAYGERPFFCREMPGYSHMAQWNRHMSRISYFMSCGLPTTDCALYLPAHSLWKDRTEADGALAAYHDLGEELEKQGISFDVIDAEGILSGEVKEGRLSVGLAEYRKVYVPQGVVLPEAVQTVIRRMDGVTKTWAWSDHPALKLRTRRDSEGHLYIMAFCQSLTAVEALVTVETTLPLWQAEASDGSFRRLAGASRGRQQLSVRLEPGQEMLICASEQEFPTTPGGSCITQKEAVLTACRRTMKLCLTQKGMQRDDTPHQLLSARDFASLEGEDFSGEITYDFVLELSREEAEGRAALVLEKLEHSAQVRVNNREAGCLCLKPWRLELPEGSLKPGINHIEIEVANTAANAYAAVDPRQWFDEAHIGPYNAREQAMEQERQDGGLFGPVMVEMYR